jgi:pyridoxamine 5'-phosphate oxidase
MLTGVGRLLTSTTVIRRLFHGSRTGMYIASAVAGLRESDLDVSPFKQFEIWFQQAVAAKIDLPHAMTLATATKDGRPSARMVLLKEFDDRGFVFYTNYDSPKGRELAENANAALVFYWRELGRQVRITGKVAKILPEESDRYFQSRPVGSRLAALASSQSAVIPSRKTLEDRFTQLAATYDHKDIPRPLHWGGFRLAPEAIEFWQGRPNRLHDRLRYTRQPQGDWHIERLAP